MAKLLIFIGVVLLVIGGVVAARARARKNVDLPVMMELRDQILRSSPEDLGITPAGDTPYVAVMEIGFPEAVVSLVTASTGDASLYFSTGGGVIGGVAHESVRQAAISFVNASANHMGSFTPTTNLDHPAKGQVRFFVRARGGIWSATADEKELRSGKEPLAPLYERGQEVITQLRLMSEGAKPPA